MPTFAMEMFYDKDPDDEYLLGEFEDGHLAVICANGCVDCCLKNR
jgi:hypothetical protein